MVPDSISIGRQIRRIRELAGLQAADLAAALGLDASAVSNIEHDRRAVKASELATIAQFLGVSQLALLEPDSLLARLPVAARAAGAPVDQSVMARLIAIAELHEVLASGGHPASPSEYAAVEEPFGSWLDRANTLAEFARQRLRPAVEEDDPFTNLVASIENELHIDVLVESFGDGSPAGASITDPEFSLIFVSSDQPRPRALFTLAHELAHVLTGDGAALNIDENLRARSDSERLANAFAAGLLMPEDEIRRTIEAKGRGAEALGEMLVEFGVSYESLVYRLHNLQIINAGGRDQLRSLGWTGLLARLEDGELGRSLLAARGSRPERRPPLLLTSRCLRGVLDGTVGAAPLAGLLGIPIDDLIESINSLEFAGALDEDYSLPLDTPEEALRSFDANPV